MGFLASMGPDVNGQGAPLDEALTAVRLIASVGPLICVNAMVSL